MKELTAREAGLEPAREDPFGDIPTMEEELGLAPDSGLIRDMRLTFEDLEGLTTSERLSRHRKATFLRAFAKRGIVGDGCQAAGVSRGTVQTNWRKEDKWFIAMYDAAIEEAADTIEAEMHRRAVEGIDVPVMYQGQPTTVMQEDGTLKMLTLKQYSDPLLALMVKGVRRNKFGDKLDVAADVNVRVGVLVVPGLADPGTWAEAAEAEQAKYAGNTGDQSVIEHDNGKGSK